MTTRDKAQELVESFPDDYDVSVDTVEDQLNQYTEEFGVPLEEAVRATRTKHEDEYDGDDGFSSGGGSAQDQDVNIGNLSPDHDEEWINIRGTVQRMIDLTEGQSSWLAQMGEIADSTGTTMFKVPQDAVDEDPSLELEEGETYKLTSVVGDEYEGSVSVQLTSQTTVTTLDETFDPPEHDTVLTGCIVDIQDVSGLIKRCPEDDCSYAVTDGPCAEHGEVEGEPDLRLKTILDDGERAHQVFFGTEATEALTGISLDDAIQMAEDAYDYSVVIQEIKPDVLGRYYTVKGNQAGEFVVVDTFQPLDREWEAEAEALLDDLANETEVEA